jgi:multidrug efflux pump subunit AcrA (membrane-fusion protein)
MPDLATILRLAPYLLALLGILGGGGYGLIERANYLQEKAARAQDLSAAQAAALRAQQEDATRSAEIAGALAAQKDQLKDQANARSIAIATAPNGNGCVASAPMRAFFAGVRASTDKAGSGQPHPSR